MAAAAARERAGETSRLRRRRVRRAGMERGPGSGTAAAIERGPCPSGAGTEIERGPCPSGAGTETGRGAGWAARATQYLNEIPPYTCSTTGQWAARSSACRTALLLVYLVYVASASFFFERRITLFCMRGYGYPRHGGSVGAKICEVWGRYVVTLHSGPLNWHGGACGRCPVIRHGRRVAAASILSPCPSLTPCP